VALFIHMCTCIDDQVLLWLCQRISSWRTMSYQPYDA
jgi:hypothetical protein